MILVMLGGLAFVFPIAVYCLILASLNRRKHPMMVPGTWDFAEVLFACSGFLVFGGPCILTSFHQRWRDYWLFGQRRALHGLHDWWFWVSLWGLYFAIVLGGSALLLWRRRLVTVIYNVEPAGFLGCLGQVLDHLQLDWVRGENRIFITGRELAADPANRDDPHPADIGTAPKRRIVLELEPFPAMRHMTLHWSTNAGELRTQIEAELENALRQFHSGPNPVGRWFLAIAGCLFGIMAFTLSFLVTMLLRLQRL